MAARPTVPFFPANDSSLANLQALSGAVAFLATTPVAWHYSKTITQGFSAGVAAAVSFGTSYFDPDGARVTPGATIQTQGYYDCEATVPFPQTATAFNVQMWFQVTTGANSPLGSGVTLTFGNLSDLTPGVAADECSLTIADTSPCLYAGDQLAVMLQCSVAVTASNTWNASGNTDLGGHPDGGFYFTGQWVSLGP